MSELVLPGVGVYHPRNRLLEGDSIRLLGIGSVEHSVERLTVNIHDGQAEVLENTRIGMVTHATLNYISGYSFSGLKYALENALFQRLKVLKVMGNGGSEPSQVHTLRMMFKCLSTARVELFGHDNLPVKNVSPDMIHRDADDNWCRVFGDTIAVSERCYPFMGIPEKMPRNLFVDCDNSFHPVSLSNVLDIGIENLTLADVHTDPRTFFTFFNRPHRLKSLRIGANPSWVRALKIRMPYPVSEW